MVVKGLVWLPEGGEFGGVMVCDAGWIGPGGQYGICLFGTGVDDRGVLNVNAGAEGGDVGDCRRGLWCCWTTTVAILPPSIACQ